MEDVELDLRNASAQEGLHWILPPAIAFRKGMQCLLAAFLLTMKCIQALIDASLPKKACAVHEHDSRLVNASA
jgi:hypothetical protein